MKKVLSIIVLLSTSILITACGGQRHEGQTTTKAPASQAEIEDSFIVMGLSESEHSEILNSNPQAVSRKLTDDIYEIRGVMKQGLLEAAPHTTVEKNHFVKPQTKPVSKEEIFNHALQNDAAKEFAPDNCFQNSLLRVPNITAYTESRNPKAQVGEKLRLESVKMPNMGLIAWYILPPQGSKINVQYHESPVLELTPDMPGTYAVALFHKRGGGCNLKVSEITVTLNEAYKPSLTAAEAAQLESLASKNFSQITATKAHLAQRVLKGEEEAVVAILDSGVNYNHPALKQQMWINKNEVPGDGVDNDGNGFVDDIVGYDFENDDSMPMDDLGHGTHVAGLAAGLHIGSGGVSNVKIMALKGGSSNGFEMGSLIKSVVYAVNNGADIINMSLGNTSSSEIMKHLISQANDHGVLIVAAAGNGDHTGQGVNNDLTPQYPASYNLPNIISVGAVKLDGSLTRYSNYGQFNVDIVTVGGYADSFEARANLLHSAYIRNPSGLLTQPMAGTSMATPLVSGVAALMMVESSRLNPADVRTLLMSTGRRSPFLRGQIASESIVDAEAALNSLQALF